MIDELIDSVIRREGGYVNHPSDRGGPTNMGITQATLTAYRGRKASVEDVRTLSRAEAAAIYRRNYWERPGFAGLTVSPVVADMVFDAAVHHGAGAAARMLQRAAGVKDDGALGPVTRAAVANLTGAALAANFVAQRAMVFGQIITGNPSQAVFARGWLNRLAEFIALIPRA